VGVVGATDEWSGFDMGESLCQSPGAERVELFRGVISMDRFVVFRRLEVLPDG